MENGGIIDDSSDIEDDDDLGTEVELYEEEFERLKKHDPTIANLVITLNCYDDWGFNKIDWKKDGNCISDNIHLKKLTIFYLRDKSQYILGQEGHNLPTRQQLQDFFSCIHRNRSIKEICINQIRINNQFSWDLIHGLHGHPSITRLQIYHVDSRDIGLEQLRKALSHPQSKLTGLRLICSLEDGGLGVVCDALLGSTLKSLCLNGNHKITSAGWRALSTVIKHPNCKLVKLNLSCTQIDDDGVNLLGNALRGSSLKVLDLELHRSISSAGWQTLLNQLSQTSIVELNLSQSKIDDVGIALLANIETVKSLRLSCNYSITRSGWRSFFNSLQRKGTQLVKLDISHNRIGNESIAALGSLLGSMSTLKTLLMSHMLYSRIDGGMEDSVTSQGWVSFFNSLQDSNLDLVKLYIDGNTIDDEGIRLLTRVVSGMNSFKMLVLNDNRLVSSTGWQALSAYLQSHFVLEELHLDENRINDDTVVAFTNSLVLNTTLKSLYLYQNPDDGDDDLITNRGWEAVSTLLCNKVSILDTYTSNHTLHKLGYDHDEMNLPHVLESYLELNKNNDKVEVARQKIIQTHFTEDNDTSNIQEFLDMELKVIPTAIEWIGRPLSMGLRGTNVSGLSLLFNLMRRLPDLFDSSPQKKSSTGKR